MIKLLHYIIFGTWHSHTWSIIKDTGVLEDNMLRGTIYHMQCKECGKLKMYQFLA